MFCSVRQASSATYAGVTGRWRPLLPVVVGLVVAVRQLAFQFINTSDFKDIREEKEFEIAKISVAFLRTCRSKLPPVLEI